MENADDEDDVVDNDDDDDDDDDERTYDASGTDDDYDDDDNESNGSRIWGTYLVCLGHRWLRFNNKSARRSLIAQAHVHLTPRPATHERWGWVCSRQ